jgi:hypothetical protein
MAVSSSKPRDLVLGLGKILAEELCNSLVIDK